MNIFQIKTKPNGKERLNEFIQDNFIAIGWNGIGSLIDLSKDELRENLKNRYEYSSSSSVGTDLGNIWTFVDTMDKGDVVLFHAHQDDVYIVKVGPYMHINALDNEIDAMAHQRKFEVMNVVKHNQLNGKLQELLRNRNAVTKFKYPIEEAELDSYVPSGKPVNTIINDEIINQAFDILCKGLNSDEEAIRVQSAIALIQYTKK
jgi:predicted Mrr-cat superfamily restriction endonuclease